LKLLITRAGLLRPEPADYARRTLVTAAIFCVGIALALVADTLWLTVVAGAVLGFAFTQVALLAHDAGHRQAFRGRRSNVLARLVLGNVILGVSHSWWTTKHNRHHAAPNHETDDPDIQFPMLAFSARQLEARHRSMRPLIVIQAFVFPLLLPFQALNMRISSIGHLARLGGRSSIVQAALLILHICLAVLLLWQFQSLLLALVFLAVQQVVFSLYNSAVFATNHKGMPLIERDGRLDFFREQVLTARNVRSNAFTDFVYGGLNFQIEHHLFPTMPRKHLGAAQRVVRRFCLERGVPYHETGMIASYKEVFGHLHRTGTAGSQPRTA
jgi:fatty acid desaturase